MNEFGMNQYLIEYINEWTWNKPIPNWIYKWINQDQKNFWWINKYISWKMRTILVRQIDYYTKSQEKLLINEWVKNAGIAESMNDW